MAALMGTTLRSKTCDGRGARRHNRASGGDGEDRSKTSSVGVGYGDNHLGRGGNLL
jgi:hypothetical protein